MRFRERGDDVRIYPRARIVSPEHVVIGDHVIIDDFVFIGSHDRLVIGSHVHIASHGSITGGGRCLIADFAGISSGARILSGTDDFSGAGLTGPTIPPELRAVVRGRVVVGAHAVVGANAVVLSGVTVGEGAVVGAGSVVTADVEPWTICVGAPARPVKNRDRETILRLEEDLYRRYGEPRRRYRDAADADLQ